MSVSVSLIEFVVAVKEAHRQLAALSEYLRCYSTWTYSYTTVL